MNRKKLTIVAPVYNEQDLIGRFYERVVEVMAQMSSSYDTTLLFVLDRSTDRSLEVLRAIAMRDPRVQLIVLSSRFGHQMSLLAGIDSATNADIIVMMDSDLQHPPETVPVLVEAYEAGHDVVYTIREDTAGVGAIRKGVGIVFYKLLSYLSQVPISENAADFRLVSKRVARVLREEIRERNLFLRGIFSWIGFRQTSVRFTAARREAGRSKYTFPRMLGLATTAILSFSTRPLRLGIVLGLSVAGMAVLLMLFTLAEYFMDRAIPSGWTTLVMLILLFSGVQLVVTGILGAYIGGIYEEVKGRPHYIVEETINIAYEEDRL